MWPLPEMGKFLRIRKAKSMDFQSVMLISEGVYEGKKIANQIPTYPCTKVVKKCHLQD